MESSTFGLFSCKVHGKFLPPFVCPSATDAKKFFVDLTDNFEDTVSLWVVGSFNTKTATVLGVPPKRIAFKKKGLLK